MAAPETVNNPLPLVIGPLLVFCKNKVLPEPRSIVVDVAPVIALKEESPVMPVPLMVTEAIAKEKKPKKITNPNPPMARGFLVKNFIVNFCPDFIKFTVCLNFSMVYIILLILIFFRRGLIGYRLILF